MLQLRLFRDRRFSAASAAIALAFLALFGAIVYLTKKKVWHNVAH